jgi:hypothetical protein
LDTTPADTSASGPRDDTSIEDDWRNWRWEYGDQPGHSPRYAVVNVGDSASGYDENIFDANFEEDIGTQTITLGWFHRYPARFAADVLSVVIAEALRKSKRPVRTILDPFCGTGAVLAASRQIMRDAVGIELTTLGQMISSVRLDPPDSISDALRTTLALADLTPTPSGVINSDLEAWIGTPNAHRLFAWLDCVSAIADARTRRFMQLAISQSLRPSSRWLAGSIKVTADPNRTPSPIERVLPRFAKQLARDCIAEYESARSAAMVTGRRRSPRTTVIGGDGLRLPLGENSVDAIITSPPYFVTYDYFEVQRLTYLAFGWKTSRHTQLGAKYGHAPNGVHCTSLVPSFAGWYEKFNRESSFLGRALRAYGEGFEQHAREALRVVTPGGLVAYSVANSVRHGEIFDLVSAVKEMLIDVGFVSVEATPRPQAGRRILPAGRDTNTGRFAGNSARAGVREYVVCGISP